MASLSDILELSLNRLNPEDVFNWAGHNWKVQGRYEWAGYCPRHDSKSGTAFKINTNTLEWYCFGCDVGGHAAQYRHFANGGNGTPKGKDFAEIVKGLAVEAGVSLQKANPREYIPIAGSGTKFRVQRQNLDELLKGIPSTQNPIRAKLAEVTRVYSRCHRQFRILLPLST
jgi:DNA primase